MYKKFKDRVCSGQKGRKMNHRKIAMANYSWNPASGCTKYSDGCKFCYACTIAERFRGKAFPKGFNFDLKPHKLQEPTKLKKPAIIFANSMYDFFQADMPKSYIEKIFDVMRQTPQHIFHILTKRAGRMYKYSGKFPENVMLGVTIESDKYLFRLDLLKQTEAKMKFLCLEPLLTALPEMDLTGIDWVICAGESGRHLLNKKIALERGLVYQDNQGNWQIQQNKIEWIRKIRDNCKKYDVPLFFKKWGGISQQSCGYLLDGEVCKSTPQFANNIKL